MKRKLDPKTASESKIREEFLDGKRLPVPLKEGLQGALQ